MKKCINLANSFVQNIKQFRSLVLENFVTVINFLFGRKGIFWT